VCLIGNLRRGDMPRVKERYGGGTAEVP
jgi:hypothetical protein